MSRDTPASVGDQANGSSLKARRDALVARSELQGLAFCHAYADAADDWLGHLFGAAVAGDPRGLALIAVGGYGRRELCPGSDLDVVLVHHRRRDHARVAEALWYPVWDQGIHLDHSVRRPSDVLTVARDDLRAALGLLDGRLITGDAELATGLLATARANWRRDARRWLVTMAESIVSRHAHHGDVAFLLEPDLKEAHGGLRDVHARRVAIAASGSWADGLDAAALDAEAAVLLQVRVELHRCAGRALDRLLLQEQDRVASSLGLADADALMATVAAAGRKIAWESDDAWRRMTGRVTRHRRRRASSGQQSGPGPDAADIPPGLVVDDGELAIGSDATVATHARRATYALLVTATSAETGLPISRALLSELSRAMEAPRGVWPDELRDNLVRVLGAGHAGLDAMEALDQSDLLVRILPEWRGVRNRPQRNAYHRFTVDRHLLETAANAAKLCDQVERPDLLLIGCLLHDIGKGNPTDRPSATTTTGDHTDVGVVLMEEMARRMGFSAPDVAVLTQLVRLHLLLPDTATRRDLSDPATIDRVAAAVGDRTTLDLLAALTEADSLATGPAAWGPWKAGLVADLVRRTRLRLAGHVEVPGPSLPTEEHRRLMADERLHIVADGSQVTVVAPDRPGLLAAVAGTLALHGLDVRSADAGGEGSMAVEVFVVNASHGRWPDWSAIATDVEAAIQGRLDLDQRLDERARAYANGPAALVADATLKVEIDNTASAVATVVEVRAPDSVGLLHRMTRALAVSGLDVAAARISTLGFEVVDAFYVRHRDGTKVSSENEMARIEENVRSAVRHLGADSGAEGDVN